jgi:hypothetical protein
MENKNISVILEGGKAIETPLDKQSPFYMSPSEGGTMNLYIGSEIVGGSITSGNYDFLHHLNPFWIAHNIISDSKKECYEIHEPAVFSWDGNCGYLEKEGMIVAYLHERNSEFFCKKYYNETQKNHLPTMEIDGEEDFDLVEFLYAKLKK